jgi:large repetitive protein
MSARQPALVGMLLLGALLDPAEAQNPFLVKDINQQADVQGSSPTGFVGMGPYAFFAARNNTFGVELWKTDGTPAGTTMVANIGPHQSSSAPAWLTRIGDTLYFAATVGVHRELWKTDGTEAGTVQVADIKAGSGAGSEPAELTNYRGTLFFTADDGSPGRQLWKSDGTAAGTVKLTNGVGTFGLPWASNLAVAAGTLFFIGGGELLKIDGTDAGTVRMTDVAGPLGLGQSIVAAGVNELFFTAHDPVAGPRLWKTDGTAEGTVPVAAVNVSNFGGGPIVVGGTLFFGSTDPDHGTELWRSDGTEAGTVLIADINLGPAGSNPSELTHMGGLVFFTADDGLSGRELWKTDGTAAGTTLVAEIGPGPFPMHRTAGLSHLAVAGERLYFTAEDGVHGLELWTTDGTAPGTMMIADINPGPGGSGLRDPAPFRETLLFQATDGRTGPEPWRTDGSAALTMQVADINSGPGSSDPKELTLAGGRVYFAADDGVSGGPALWRTDGTQAGTARVTHRHPRELTAFGGMLAFVTGSQVWRTDGTEAGTFALTNVFGQTDFRPQDLTAAEDVLFFAADAGTSGLELWKSDGTPEGTGMVADINPAFGAGSLVFPRSYAAVGGTLFFSASDGVSGAELWRSDGTAEGTYQVADVNPGPGGSSPSLAVWGGRLFFSADDGTSGRELWTSDGTAAGTFRVADISPGPSGSLPEAFTVAAGSLFFTAHDGISGTELWKTDGTEAGTVRVADRVPGPGSGAGTTLTAGGGALFFLAQDAEHGFELWRSDGTEPGTSRVADINPGAGSAFFSNHGLLLGTANGVVFEASDGVSGRELWMSDGTEAGTVRMEIAAGVAESEPDGFVQLGDLVLFAATEWTTSRELWAVLAPGVDNDPPAAVPDLYATEEDAILTVETAAGVLANDVDGAGGVLSAQLHTPPFSGSLELSADGSFRYRPDPEFAGIDAFRYTVTDGTYVSLPALVKIAVHPVDDAPVAADDHFTALEDTALTVPAPGLLANDFDPDGGGLAVVLGAVPSHGALSLAADGSFTYSPLPDFSGTDTFTYSATDGGLASTATVTITVTPVRADFPFLVKDINLNSGPACSSDPRELTAGEGVLFFVADDGLTGAELWKSSGVPEGTVQVADLRFGTAGSMPHDLTYAGETLFFLAADDGIGSPLLWRSDGTRSGTRPLIGGSPEQLIDVGGTLFFSADDGVSGRELWKSDGTLAGTVQVANVNTNQGGSSILRGGTPTFTAFKGSLFFVAGTPASSFELWKSDGTAGGTVQVAEINPGAGNALPSELFATGETLFFQANDGTTGTELWKTDGTAAGTVRVADINPGAAGSVPRDFAALGAAVFFVAHDGASGFELWKTDGTTAGTVRVTDLAPGSASAGITGLTSTGALLFFATFDAAAGRELWASDGTEAGTRRIVDLNPGTGSGVDSGPFFVSGSRLLFRGSDGSVPDGLWTTDGTPTGTMRVGDVRLGSFGLEPPEFERVQDVVFFAATGSPACRELWAIGAADQRLDRTAPSVTPPDDITVAAVDAAGTPASDAGIQSFLAGAIATDAVDGSVDAVAVAAPAMFPLGATVVTFEARDAAGNVGRATATLRIADQTAPIITPPANIVLSTTDALGVASSHPAIQAFLAAASAVDNVDGVVGVVALEPPAVFPVGLTWVVFQAWDAAGNTWQGAANVTVVLTDRTPPVVTAPASIVVAAVDADGTPASDLAIQTFLAGAAAVDDVDGLLPALAVAPPTVFPLGTTVVVFEATDAGGNAAQATGTVTVTDQTPPTVMAPVNILVAAVDATGAPASHPTIQAFLAGATALDNVDGTVAPIAVDSPGVFPVGTTAVTFHATDAAGNLGHATASVRIEDQSPPLVTVPADIVVAAVDATGTPVSEPAIQAFLAGATAVDDVDGSVAVSPLAPPDVFPLGLTWVTFAAVDAAGNTRHASAAIVVQDLTPPAVTAPASIVVAAIDAAGTPSSQATIQAFLAGATAADNVDGVVVATALDPPIAFPLGTTVVAFEAVDEPGNAGHATASVTVTDQAPPVITAPPDRLAEANGNPLSTLDVGRATADDRVDGDVVVASDAPAGFPLGTTLVTYTAVDAAGNAARATQSVTVADTTPPALAPPPDMDVIATGALTSVAIGSAAAQDLFGPVSIHNDAPGAFPVGETRITWTATDGNGNRATATQVVRVRSGRVGFLPPLSPGQVYKAGRVIPVKVSVVSADGSHVRGLRPVIAVTRLSAGEPVGEPLDVEAVGGASAGSVLVDVGSHYQFNLATREIGSGWIRIAVGLGDGGPPHAIDIALK